MLWVVRCVWCLVRELCVGLRSVLCVSYVFYVVGVLCVIRVFCVVRILCVIRVLYVMLNIDVHQCVYIYP